MGKQQQQQRAESSASSGPETGRWVSQLPLRLRFDNDVETSSQKEYLKSTQVEDDTRPSAPDGDPGPPSPPPPVRDVKDARADIHKQLSLCRQLIITFELTRMRQSRIGSQEWFHLWRRVYTDEIGSGLCRRVADTMPVIARLFFSAVRKLCALTKEIERRVDAATSIEETDQLLDEISDRGLKCCEERRKRAVRILEAMRKDFVYVPIAITDNVFSEIERDIFGVDGNGNYHPPHDENANIRDKSSKTELNAADFLDQEPDLWAHEGFTSEFQSSLEEVAQQLFRHGTTRRWSVQ